MSEKIKAILDAVTDKVLAYRPADKGEWAKKNERAAKGSGNHDQNHTG